MKLIYFDEAKDSPEHPFYHIGAVCIDDTDLRVVEEKISAIATDAFGTDELKRGTELHAAEIYHRKNHFKEWVEVERRVALLDKLVHVLNMPEVLLIDIRVNCDRLYGNQKASDLAFMFLVEKADELMRSLKSVGMLIGDRDTDRLADRYACALSTYRASGTDFRLGRGIEMLVDSVHFTHSHLSRFLQLADVYTWLLQFQKRNESSTEPRHKAVLSLCRQEGVNLFPSKYRTWPNM